MARVGGLADFFGELPGLLADQRVRRRVRGGVPPRRLRPGVAASPLAGKRVHGAGSFAPSAESAWGAGAALSAGSAWVSSSA